MVSPVVAQAILGLQAPDIVGSFEKGQEIARQEQIKALSGEALAGKEGSIQRLGNIAPEIALKLGQLIGARNDKDISDFIQSAGVGRRMLESGQNEGALQLVNQRIAITAQQGGNTAPLERMRTLIATNPQAALQEMKAFEDSLSNSSAALKTYAHIQFTRDDGTIGYGIPAIDPRTGRTTFEEIPAPAGASFISGRETPEEAAAKAQARKSAEAKVEMKFKPMITKAVKEAEIRAQGRGEALSEIDQMNAAMPGLEEAVSQLKSLAPIATYTMAGKAFDVAAKELGFGSTEGSTARARFIAIVNNQVLPLLKPTFGAAFTKDEGNELKRTMGDPDAAPDAKIAELEAFIEQKRRTIETKQREAGIMPQGMQQNAPQQQAQQAIPLPDVTKMSDEELMKIIGAQ